MLLIAEILISCRNITFPGLQGGSVHHVFKSSAVQLRHLHVLGESFMRAHILPLPSPLFTLFRTSIYFFGYCFCSRLTLLLPGQERSCDPVHMFSFRSHHHLLLLLLLPCGVVSVVRALYFFPHVYYVGFDARVLAPQAGRYEQAE